MSDGKAVKTEETYRGSCGSQQIRQNDVVLEGLYCQSMSPGCDRWTIYLALWQRLDWHTAITQSKLWLRSEGDLPNVMGQISKNVMRRRLVSDLWRGSIHGALSGYSRQSRSGTSHSEEHQTGYSTDLYDRQRRVYTESARYCNVRRRSIPLSNASEDVCVQEDVSDTG